MIALFAIFMVVCATFVWIGSPNLRLEQELIFQLFGTILVASTFLLNKTKPIERNGISRWLGIFAIYTVILFLLSGGRMGAGVMFNTFLCALLYFCTLQLDAKHTKLILKTILWISVANILFVTVQLSGYDPLFIIKGPNDTVLTGVTDPIGFFGNKAIMGMYMALAIIAGLIITPLSILMLPLVYMSKSTGDIIGVLTGILLFAWWMRRKLFFVLFPVLLLCGIGYVVLVDSPMGMMGTRPPMWKAVIHDTLYGVNLNNPLIQSPFVKNPFTGYGVDSFRTGNIKYFINPETGGVVRGFITAQNQLVDYKGTTFIQKNGELFTPDNKRVDLWDNPHNAFVELFYNYGFFGLAIIGFLFFHIWKRFENSIKTKEVVVLMALIVTFMMFTISQFPFSLARIAHLIPILLGLFVLNTEESNA